MKCGDCIDPKRHPNRFCVVWCCVSVAVSVIAFFGALQNQLSSKNDNATDDTPLILDSIYIQFASINITHFTLNTDQYPNTYGVIVYVENPALDGYYDVSLKYLPPNSVLAKTCGSTNVGSDAPSQFICDIHPKFFQNGTLFTITLNNCHTDFGEDCSATISVAFLSINQLSTSTKYTLQTSFDEWNLYAIGISRYHYFTINTKYVDSFEITDKDENGWDDCEFMLMYNRCIYVAPKTSPNVSFVDEDNAKNEVCQYNCHDGDYYLQTLSVDVESKVNEYLVGVYVDAGSIDSTDLSVDGTDLKLYIEEDYWYYTWIILAGAVLFCLCCMIPACWTWYKHVGRMKYNKWKMDRKKKKFLKEWRLFYVNRYNMLMELFGEKGVVDLIQSYMDDLEIIYDLRDDRVFSIWYSTKYDYQQAFDIGLDKPLLQ